MIWEEKHNSLIQIPYTGKGHYWKGGFWKEGNAAEGRGQIPWCDFHNGCGEAAAPWAFTDLRGLWYKVYSDSWQKEYFWRNAMEFSQLGLEKNKSAGAWWDLKMGLWLKDPWESVIIQESHPCPKQRKKVFNKLPFLHPAFEKFFHLRYPKKMQCFYEQVVLMGTLKKQNCKNSKWWPHAHNENY